MLKKIVCFAFGLVLALAVFTGCSDDGDAISAITGEASRYTTTLNMWVIAEEGNDPQQAAAVNAAINKITKSKYKTQINIKYLTEDQYYAKVEEAFTLHEQAIAEAEAAAKANRGQQSTSAPQSDEVILNEYGVPELKYPTVPDYQIDILFIGNFEKYRSYADKGWIVALDGLIENSGGQITNYVESLLLDAARYNGISYAVPNRCALGEYTYLMVNEALMNSLGYTPESFATSDETAYSIFSSGCRDFLDDVKNNPNSAITPIYAEGGVVDLSLVHYWSFNMNAATGNCIQQPALFSLFGATYQNSTMRGTKIGYGNLLLNGDYQTLLETKVHYETTPGYITSDPDATTAVRVITGGPEVRAKYEALGYKTLLVEAPRATDADVYNSMFAIGGHSANESRAMEILSFLNTNVEIRNLLQYGIEGENYNLKTETRTIGQGENAYFEEITYVVPTETNAYRMDPAKTGNMFLLYPNSPEDVVSGAIGIKQWEYDKLQNLDALAYPTLGLYFDSKYTVNTRHIRVVEAVSAAFERNVIRTFASESEVTALFDAAFNTSDNEMATLILNEIGEPVLLDGVAITVADLEAALVYMKSGEIVKGQVEQALAALYDDWLKNSGVNAK